MIQKDINLLRNEGWIIECDAPFQIRHKETNSYATNKVAWFILNSLKQKYKNKEYLVLRRANCGVFDPSRPTTDIIGITSSEENAKKRISIFCYYEPIINLDDE